MHYFDVASNQKSWNQSLYYWIQYANVLHYQPLNNFIKTLTKWQKQIADCANQRITNAVTEGFNNLAGYFKRLSFEVPNFQNMRLRILVASQ